jgi:hypothetical protein
MLQNEDGIDHRVHSLALAQLLDFVAAATVQSPHDLLARCGGSFAALCDFAAKHSVSLEPLFIEKPSPPVVRQIHTRWKLTTGEGSHSDVYTPRGYSEVAFAAMVQSTFTPRGAAKQPVHAELARSPSARARDAVERARLRLSAPRYAESDSSSDGDGESGGESDCESGGAQCFATSFANFELELERTARAAARVHLAAAQGVDDDDWHGVLPHEVPASGALATLPAAPVLDQPTRQLRSVEDTFPKGRNGEGARKRRASRRKKTQDDARAEARRVRQYWQWAAVSCRSNELREQWVVGTAGAA